MKHDTCLLAPMPAVEPAVTVLNCPAALRLDPEPLMQIFADQGEVAAEETVCRALEDLARRINDLQSPRERCAFAEIGKPVRRIAAIASQIGLIEVAIAAEGVAKTAQQRDGVALEATMARLERGFDSAISQVWNFSALI